MSKNNKNNNNNKKARSKRQAKNEDNTEEKKPERRPAETTLLGALSKYAVPCSKDGHLICYLKAEGIPCYPVEGWQDGPSDHHIVTHAARTYATILIYRDACNTAQKMELAHPDALSIIDVFGRETEVRLPRAIEGVGVTVHPVRPRLYGGDLGRAFLRDLDDDGFYHAAMMVDIYQHGEASNALDPVAVASAAVRTQTSTCYVVIHNLDELYGAHVFRATYGKGEDRRAISSIEGSWFSVVQDGKRYISFKPDSKSPPYPLHPYPEWLATGSHRLEHEGRTIGWLHSHLMNTSGPYEIWKCVVGDEEPRPVHEIMKSEPHYFDVRLRLDSLGAIAEILTKKSTTILASCGGMLREFAGSDGCEISKEIGYLTYHGIAPIDVAVARHVQTTTFMKSINGRVIQSALAAAHEAFVGTPLWNVSKRHPSLVTTVILNSMVWGLCNRVDEIFLEKLEDIPQINRDRVWAANAAKALPKAWWKEAWNKYWKPVTGGLALAALGWWWWKSEATNMSSLAMLSHATGKSGDMCVQAYRDTAAYTLSLDGILNVTGEEIWKYATGWIGTYLLAGIEAVNAIRYTPASLDGLLMTLAVRIPPTMLHLWTSYRYYQHGWSALPLNILAHTAFNFLTCVSIVDGIHPYRDHILAQSTDQIAEGLSTLWSAEWAIGRDSNLKGVEHLDPSSKLRAFPARTDVEPSLKDWRAKTLKLKLNGTVISLDEAKQLQEKPCLCSHLTDDSKIAGCESCGSACDSKFCYPLAITSGHLWQPSPGAWGTVACVALRDFVDNHRIYVDKHTEAVAMMTAEARLDLIRDTMVTMLAGMPIHNWFTDEECAQALGGFKGHAYRAAVSDVDQHGKVERTKVQIKYNETIKCAPATADQACAHVKPRSVKNVSTQDQTEVLPFSRAMDKDFKTHFDGSRVHTVNGFQVRFVVTHATRENMRRYASMLAECPDIVIIVSCDDMIMSTGRYRSYFGFQYAELDFESFDQSQHAAFWLSDRKILKAVSNHTDFEAFWNHHFEINQMPVKAVVPLHERRHHHPAAASQYVRDVLELSAQIRIQMRTGVATTSILGSFHSIEAYVYWLMMCSEGAPYSMTQAMSDLFLTAKLKTSETLEECTFLKGFFWSAGGESDWAVLPSTVLKVGKLMKDPRSLFHGEQPDVYAAALDAVCSSIQVSEDYPILGAFVQMAKRLRADRADAVPAPRVHLSAFMEDHQYKLRTASAPREVVLAFMHHRYGISEEEVCECEALLSQVERLPVLICHPAFEKMRGVDYC